MRNYFRSLIYLCLICTILASGIGAWKLATLRYNALDFSIYSQVFWNTSHGDWFANSIQNSNYLGDHAEIFIAPLSMLMHIFPTPLLLIVLQNLALFGAGLLIFLLARHSMPPKVSFFISIAYLLNPVIWNMALFEFHLIVFVIPLILASIYMLTKRRFWPFIILCLATSMIREDAGLAVFGIGLYALIAQKSLRWWLWPLIISSSWFVLAMAIIRLANPHGYKFFAYYNWLGNSLSEALTTIVTRPLYVLANIFCLQNLLLLLSLILLFLFLPLLKPKSLVLVIPAILQLMMGKFSPQLLIETHYLALIIPLLFVLSIEALDSLKNSGSRILQAAQRQYATLTTIIIFAVLGYSFLFLSPAIGVVRQISQKGSSAASDKSLITSLPSDASIISSYRPMALLSQRKDLYSLHYLALGRKQFSTEPYEPRQQPQYIVLDPQDLTLYELQYASLGFSKDLYTTTHERLRNLFHKYTITRTSSTLLLMNLRGPKGMPADEQFVSIGPVQVQMATSQRMGPVTLSGWAYGVYGVFDNALTLQFTVAESITDSTKGYGLRLRDTHNPNGSYDVPFGWNLWPLHAVQKGDTVTMHIPMPGNLRAANNFSISLFQRKGYAGLDDVRSARAYITEEEVIEPSAHIPITQ